MRLRNRPQVIPRSSYTKAISAVKKYARGIGGIKSVYMIGTVTQPGISDLDLLFILDDALTSPIKIEEALPTSVRRLVGRGTLLKVPEYLASQVQIIDDFPLQHVWGETYPFVSFNQPLFEVCRVMDWLPERLFTLQQLRQAPSLDVTWTLQFLKSLTVSLSKLALLTGATTYQTFIQEVQTTRATWWRMRTHQKQLTDLLAQAAPLGLQALRDSEAYVFNQKYIRPGRVPPRAQFSIPGGPRFSFGPKAGVRKTTVTLPPAFYAFYAAQAQLSTGWLKQALQDSFTTAPHLTTQQLSRELQMVLQQRLAFVAECGSFLRRAGFKRGLLKYGWFLA